MQTSIRSFFKKAILAIALFVGFMSLESKAALPPGVYPAFYSASCSPSCCYVPANNCIIIVFSTQTVYSDGTFGPLIGPPVPCETDPHWLFEGTTLENNTLRFNP